MIVIGFLPPYYPHRANKRQSDREIGLLEAVNQVIDEARDQFDETLAISEHFASISDLSYVGFRQARGITASALNTPDGDMSTIFPRRSVET